ncbi:MAG: PepSY domain-containing protein [Alphaproteobacteria bacterium]|nr:PepSY domain-containing protein [Alphaproteobacteria bacterium]
MIDGEGLCGRPAFAILVPGVFMRILILVFVVLALGAFPAFAQSIKVIHDDGSVEVLDLNPDSQTPPPEEPASPRKEAAPAPVSEPATEKAVEKPAPQKPAPAKAKPKKKKEKKAEKKPKTVYKPPQPAPERIVPPGTVITPELATSIALDHAPPVRDVKVVRRTYQGREVFVVTFKTEDGISADTLIDAATGAVIPGPPR